MPGRSAPGGGMCRNRTSWHGRWRNLRAAGGVAAGRPAVEAATMGCDCSSAHFLSGEVPRCSFARASARHPRARRRPACHAARDALDTGAGSWPDPCGLLSGISRHVCRLTCAHWAAAMNRTPAPPTARPASPEGAARRSPPLGAPLLSSPRVGFAAAVLRAFVPSNHALGGSSDDTFFHP